MGREKHFKDEDELLYFFKEYLEEVEKRNIKRIEDGIVTKFEYPNLAGFARKCFCDKDTLLNYKVENHPFFGAMKIIYTFLEDETLANKMTDNFKKFYMTNTFREYKDKQEVETTSKSTIDINNISPDELQDKINKILGK